MSYKRKNTKNMLALLLLIWSFPPVVIKYLDHFFPPLVQNFYRYLAASVFLLFFSFFLFPQEFRACIKKLGYFIIPALILFCYQTLFVYGISFTQANTASFLSKLTGIFVILVAWVSLPEERQIMKKNHFFMGFFLAFGGAGLITLGKGKLIFSLGSFLVILSTFFWALYTIQMKRLLIKLRITPLMAMSFITSLASSFLFFPALPHLEKINQTPLPVNFLLLFSGFFLVGAGGAIYYFLLRRIGATITNNAMLLTSFVTAIFSFIFLGEGMTIWQIAGGGLLIPGCYFILKQTGAPGGEFQA